MILIIGSEASGKKEYVKGLGYTDDQISECINDNKPVLYGLHRIVAADPEKIRNTLSRIENLSSGKSLSKTDTLAASEEAADFPANIQSAAAKSDKINPADQWLTNLLAKEIIVCNEVGSGIIPMLASERMYREQTGRLCTLLASHAEHVIRMVCGIPVTLR